MKPTRHRVRLDQIITADCARALTTLPEDSINLTVTSPPYDDMRDYDGHLFDFTRISRELYRVTAPGGVLVWVSADGCGPVTSDRPGETGTSMRQVLHFMSLGFTLHQTLFAEWPNKMPKQKYRYERTCDPMYVLCKGSRPSVAHIRRVPCATAGTVISIRKGHSNDQDGVFRARGGPRHCVTVNPDKPEGSVWRYNTGQGQTSGDPIAHDHPCPFPEALARDHIASWSNPGDVVLDPFCGSGTTLKMAKLADRYWVGIDVCPEYTEMTAKRLAFHHRRDLPAVEGRQGRPVYLESVVAPRVVRLVSPPPRSAPPVAFDWQPDEPTLGVAAVARQTGRTYEAVLALIKRDRLPARRLGNNWRVPVRAVADMKPAQRHLNRGNRPRTGRNRPRPLRRPVNLEPFWLVV